jgi:ribosomal protein L11 methyltransferase
MNNTLQLTITLKPSKPWTEILISELSELGFDAFEEFAEGVKAYGPENNIKLQTILEETILADNSLDFDFELEQEIIPFQNWNAQWEADFQPVFVEDKLAILAPFHEKPKGNAIIVEILPKMSFGTGHHQTTWMMSKRMFDLEVKDKSVLDMGTGTGVLAILAEKLGAKAILAIDIEDWSVENTIENRDRNACKSIEAQHGDVDLIDGKLFDVILANINKNVLKKHFDQYVKSLKTGGKLLISGFFETDVQEMKSFAEKCGLTHEKTLLKETWAQLSFKK